MKTINILALDPAIKTGWAVYHKGQYYSGVEDFSRSRKVSAGDAYRAMHVMLTSLVERYRPFEVFVIETPTPRSIKSAAIQHGMYAIPQLYAAFQDIGYTVVFPNEVKSFVKKDLMGYEIPYMVAAEARDITGGNKNKMNSVLYYYKHHYIMPSDDNEADAYALLRYYIAKMKTP